MSSPIILTSPSIHPPELDLTKDVEILQLCYETDNTLVYTAILRQEMSAGLQMLNYFREHLLCGPCLDAFIQSLIQVLRLRLKVKVEVRVLLCFHNPLWRRLGPGVDIVMPRLIEHALIWQRLDHPNISKFYGLFFRYQPGPESLLEPLLVVQDCGKDNVVQYVKYKNDYEKLDLLRQVAEGLKYLHRHNPPIIHGNLRGANIIVDALGQPRICEYDLEPILEYESEQRHPSGKLRWRAPELYSLEADLVDDDPSVDSRSHSQSSMTRESDIYAWAMTAIEIFTGEKPFKNIRSDTHVLIAVLEKQAQPELPPFLAHDEMLSELIYSCWARKPDERPSAERVCAVCTKVLGM